MNKPVLELINLKKSIKGREIIKGLNLTLNSSQVYGFLGPNGAGKTTTLRMIVGLIRPTSGSVNICGYSISKNYVKAISNIGCIIENPEMYKFLSGLDNLQMIQVMEKNISNARVDEVIEFVGLKNRVKDKVATYSLGMKQRLGIAQAILKKPRLLILDEPTNGLDPAGINEFRKLVRHLAAEENMTVFVSSHLLSEVQMMCDQVAIIKQGLIVKTADIKEFTREEWVVWEMDDPQKALEIMKEKFNLNGRVENESLQSTAPNTLVPDINKAFIESGLKVKFVGKRQKSLEELFLEITEGDIIA
ncbi:MAG: ABC transporter ATP-binding protein [Clostridia bacterium]|nr:ABC transporter ATP-binding protein [Clostridia bacterium]